MIKPNKNISIITCCIDDWGGSEELWARSIPYLKEYGCRFTIYKNKINFDHTEIKNLQKQEVSFIELDIPPPFLKKIGTKIYQYVFKRSATLRYGYSPYTDNFRKSIEKTRPDLVIIAQGINFDGLGYAHQCFELGIPYCIIVQKAVEFFWPPKSERQYMKEVFKNAQKCYFISQHNKNLTEEQFGIRLNNNAEVIWNPIKIKREPLPYPSTLNGYKVACVGRLFIIDKGQDILLRILSKEPWRSRPFQVSFIGSGLDEEGLKELAQLLQVSNIKFIGHKSDITGIWKEHHALILPSRNEGMALSVLEAMAAGRTVIVTTAGGHSEIVQHKTDGFIGDATEKDFEKAMEDAWDMREEWEQIGLKAWNGINQKAPSLPERSFAESILKIINEQ